MTRLIPHRYTSVIGAVGEEYHVSDIVSTLGATLFLLGYANTSRKHLHLLTLIIRFGIGPLLWAPLSEIVFPNHYPKHLTFD